MGGFHLLQRPTLAITTATLTLLLLTSASTHSFAQPGSREQEPERTAVQWRELRAVGLGSSPPTCRSKCGNCSPCKPVHVPIRSGSSLPYEYYPEAWRCKCGDKLFMP